MVSSNEKLITPESTSKSNDCNDGLISSLVNCDVCRSDTGIILLLLLSFTSSDETLI